MIKKNRIFNKTKISITLCSFYKVLKVSKVSNLYKCFRQFIVLIRHGGWLLEESKRAHIIHNVEKKRIMSTTRKKH